MAKIQFTSQEYAQLASTLDRMMIVRKELPHTDWKKGINKVIKQLAAKFPPTQHEACERILDRQQLRAVEELLVKKYKVLDQDIIPEYARRAPASERLQQATELRETVQGLLKKVQEAL
jgi:hypothetical protein